ncbi:hypothetical protein SCLCIDRAFT_28410 [Scleroderma citrinum Foug A]|uniref:Uncharacterized protein n=1 Tax=Scleroderma citrinum Foug A TaxID=1036808 RepID=A0A0C3DBE8_9AGAM|nr:hypothetical protein SCLCIDRAFT_28410 [Scleroderma citrinum Foug A]
MSVNYSRAMLGREGNEVPSKHDWMKANLEELDLVDEDSEATVTEKAQECHCHKQVRQLEAECWAWEATEVAKRCHREEDAAHAALERSKTKMREVAKAMRQGGARESELMDSECQESCLGPMLLHPLCGRCTRQGTTCILPPGAKSQMCQGCRKLKVKCHPGKGVMMTMAAPVITEWSVGGEKRKGESSVVLLRKGEKRKCTKRVMANAASIEEIEAALRGPMTAGPLQQRLLDLVAKALKQFEWLTGVTMTNYLRMTNLLNWLGEPKLMRDKGKARAVKDEEEESDWEDGDEDGTDK